MKLYLFKYLRPVCALVLGAALLMPMEALHAQNRISAQPGGADAISRFLMNFGRFIDWPDSAFSGAADEFRVCVMGENHLGRSLERTLGNRSVGDRTFTIVELAASDVAQASGCQILYVSFSEASRVGEITSALNGTAVLTVAEIAQFPENGGMIELAATRGNDISMRMHSALIAEAGLNVREQLHRAMR